MTQRIQTSSIARGGLMLGVLLFALVAGADGVPAGSALHVVNSTGDQADAFVGDGACDVDLVTFGPQCTLRAAFQELVAGTVVNFNIPGCPPACTISPTSALPQLANNNEIDGTSQPGFDGTPLITIDGTNINDGPGIRLGSSRISTIRGLVIRDLPDDPGISGGAVDSLVITNTIISGNAGPGVSVSRSLDAPVTPPTIALYDSEFTNNTGYGVLAGVAGYPYDVALIHGNAFTGNGFAIQAYLSDTVSFTDNIVSDNLFGGAQLLSGSQNSINDVFATGNTFERNGGSGITTGGSGTVLFVGNEARDNSGDGADLAGRINEMLTVTDNVLEDNGGSGLRSRATGVVSIAGNTFARNVGDGANITYEQYVGSGVPPPAALTLTGNEMTGNFGTGLLSTDNFWNFPMTATRNSFLNNGQGLVTSATHLSASDNTFSLNAAEGLVATRPGVTGGIAENTITGNGRSMSLNGDGIGVHFNRIVSNQLPLLNPGLGVTNAENNWWGCSEGLGRPFCDSTGQAVDGNPWLVLTPFADPTTIFTGETSTITGDFTINSDAADTSASGQLPDGTLVEFSTDLGSFDGSAFKLQPMSSGVATAVLEADAGPGTAHVQVGLDTAGPYVDVVINAAPQPSQTPTSSASPTASPGPTATAPPQQRKQGDVDCDGDVDGRDAVILGLDLAELPLLSRGAGCPSIGSGSPRFGDLNCDGVVDARDMLGPLAFLAEVSFEQGPGCTDLGDLG